MKNPDILRLEALFKRLPPPVSMLTTPLVANPAPGQIWKLESPLPHDVFRDVMVVADPVEGSGLETVDVAPLIHDATISGPKDFILPENVLCHDAVVLLGMCFSLPVTKLDTCQGGIETCLLQEILTHYVNVQNGTLALSARHAHDLYDEHDLRFRFQEQVSTQVTRLQTCIYEWLDQVEDDGERVLPKMGLFEWLGKIPNIEFPHLEQWFPQAVMAAGEGLSDMPRPFTERFTLDGHDIELTLRRSIENGIAVVVRGDKEGRCTRILALSGKEIGTIDNGQSVTPFQLPSEIGDAFVIADENGQPLVRIKVR